MERTLAELEEMLAGQEFGSSEEINAIPSICSMTPLWRRFGRIPPLSRHRS
jgi:hypothetical protein